MRNISEDSGGLVRWKVEPGIEGTGRCIASLFLEYSSLFNS